MCCCQKPNKNGEPGYSWDGINIGTRPISAPELKEGEILLYDEPGRCKPQVNGKGGIDYHSHHFRVIKNKDLTILAVRHGGGEERIELGYTYTRIAELLALLPDSDARYLMLHALYDADNKASRKTENERNTYWRTAAAEGRIKTRKRRGQNKVDVWVQLTEEQFNKETPHDR